MTARRFPQALAASAMGVYLLLVAGATTAVTEATAACAGFPLCGDAPAAMVAVALAHRVIAVAVGLVVLGTALAAIRARPGRRVAATLGGAVLLFPVQAAVGALVATVGPETTLAAVAGVPFTEEAVRLTAATLHAAVGLSIFAGLLAALAWELEARTGQDEDVSATAVGGSGATATTGGADPTAGQPTAAAAQTETASARTETGQLSSVLSTARAYYRLMKPRLMWLLCLVAAAAMGLAGGDALSPSVAARTLIGGALAIGASGTFNHVLERDVDRRMQRTSDRPLAVDRVSVRNAVVFGVLLTVVALATFASINLLTATLGAAAIGFYAVIYTLVLKPNTVQNTVIGGAAGALPALIGWAAVTGSIGWGGVGLAALIFLWTPAHFYNLALAYREDYERAGFPMLPVVRGETTTRRHILGYLTATLAVGAMLAGLPQLDWLYAGAGVLVGSVFLWAVVRLHYEQTERAAFRAFHASNAYLGTVLAAMVIDTLVI